MKLMMCLSEPYLDIDDEQSGDSYYKVMEVVHTKDMSYWRWEGGTDYHPVDFLLSYSDLEEYSYLFSRFCSQLDVQFKGILK